jgi:hypothetical protein
MSDSEVYPTRVWQCGRWRVVRVTPHWWVVRQLLSDGRYAMRGGANTVAGIRRVLRKLLREEVDAMSVNGSLT